ncbi:helix-turn-helix domain-containing protein [bacterium]|nr:helix-turn-helix domain-containing protein [bacterium]
MTAFYQWPHVSASAITRMLLHFTYMQLPEIRAILNECRRTPESRYIQRLHGVLLVLGGLSTIKAAKLLKTPQRTVADWMTRYKESGLEGLKDAPKSGRPSSLTATQRRVLKHAISHSPERSGFKVSSWTGDLVSGFLRKRFKLKLSRRQGLRLLRRYEVKNE